MKGKFEYHCSPSIWAILALLLAGCGFPVQTTMTVETLNPALTVAAQTIRAAYTDTPIPPTATETLTPTPETPTDTPRPTNTPLPIPTDTPQATATDTATPLTPTAASQATNTPQPTLSDYFYEDDFEGAQSWAVVEEGGFLMEYTTGSYRIQVKMNTGDNPVRSVRSAVYQDVRIEVDVTKHLGSDDNYFGLLCRYQDPRNYYRLVVSPDGNYQIGKKLDGQLIALGLGAMGDVYKKGEVINHLRADCAGNVLALYLNGTKLLEVTDSSFLQGSIGLVVGTRSDEGADVYFDNFSLSKP